MTKKQVLFILKTLDDDLTHLHAVHLLIIIQQSWHHLWADFPHSQIFGYDLPNTVLFHVQQTCDPSDNRRSPLTNCLTHSTLTSVLFFERLLSFYLNCVITLKKNWNTCAYFAYIFMITCNNHLESMYFFLLSLMTILLCHLGPSSTLAASLLRGKTPLTSVLDTMWWWGFSNNGALGNGEHLFIAITPTFTLAQSGSIW